MNCKACKFFYITWDKKFPYGCKLYEIKSKTTPEVQVLVNTSIACLGYQPKINKSNQRWFWFGTISLGYPY